MSWLIVMNTQAQLTVFIDKNNVIIHADKES